MKVGMMVLETQVEDKSEKPHGAMESYSDKKFECGKVTTEGFWGG